MLMNWQSLSLVCTKFGRCWVFLLHNNTKDWRFGSLDIFLKGLTYDMVHESLNIFFLVRYLKPAFMERSPKKRHKNVLALGPQCPMAVTRKIPKRKLPAPV